MESFGTCGLSFGVCSHCSGPPSVLAPIPTPAETEILDMESESSEFYESFSLLALLVARRSFSTLVTGHGGKQWT